MSSEQPKNVRRSLSADDDDDDDDDDASDYPYHEEQMASARRFLWDEDEPQPTDPGDLSASNNGGGDVHAQGTIPAIGESVALMDTAGPNLAAGRPHEEIDLEDNNVYVVHQDSSMGKSMRRSIFAGTGNAAANSDRSIPSLNKEYAGPVKGRGPVISMLRSVTHACWEFLRGFFSNTTTGLFCLMFVILLVGGLFLRRHLSKESHNSTTMNKGTAATNTQAQPALPEGQGRLDAIKKILHGNPNIDSNLWDEDGSPQFQALQWMGQVDTFEGDDTVERYALAVLFFSTGGEVSDDGSVRSQWETSDGWLSADSSFCDWYGVQCLENEMVDLNLTSNKIKGTIPGDLSAASTLVSLDLSVNEFAGSVPAQINNLVHLETLLLFHNRLDGAIPDMSALTSLKTFNIGQTLISAVPEAGFAKLTSMKSLGLQNTNLGGSISDLHLPPNLESLYLDRNNMGGKIPDELYKLTNLQEVRLEKNLLTGTLSTQLGALTNLVSFRVFANKLTGTVPDVFGRLSVLEEFWLLSNNFKGMLPSSLWEHASIKALLIGENQFTGTVPEALGKMKSAVEINLAHNNFKGSLPEIFDSLTDLQQLALDHNSFEGSLPTSLGRCSQLSQLMVDGNSFVGQVPPDWGSLETLTRVNLERTLLTGSMPTELCTLVDSGTLEFLAADCAREGGIECSCCHRCI